MAIWCADIESTGILEDMRNQDSPMLHNFGAINQDTGEEVLFSRSKNNLWQLQEFLDEGHTFVMHNGIPFDREALKMLGWNVDKMVVIDTLALSWYLYPQLRVHGLAAWGETFGVPKPPIEDWENLTPEEYDHRVMEDCKIQVKVWKHFKQLLDNLYGNEEGVNRIINHLNSKMEQQALQQHYRWVLDVGGCSSLLNKLEAEKHNKFQELQAAMPQVPVYVKRKRPAKPFKGNGQLSVVGEGWKALTDALGLPFDHDQEVKVVAGYREANAGSHAQIKDWLFSLGWEPRTFEYVRNKETGEVKAIPQVGHSDGEGRLCDSVEEIISKHPELGIHHLRGVGILAHRISILKGFLRNMNADGTITASCNGFTNTLRLKHSVLVNLPSTRVPWGKEIRGLLTAPKGFKNIGSDLSSLEDRCKHHFQWKFDPEYVKMQMQEGYDPHLQVCIMGGLLTDEQVRQHKAKECDYSHIRHLGKGGNYACQYGAGVETLSNQLGIPTSTAKAVHEGYWKLNKSIKQIAKSVRTKQCNGQMWLWNPISKLWYWLKTEKDKFSTLCQGLGAYIFDRWCAAINYEVKRRYGRPMPLVAQFHDELILMVKDGSFIIWEEILKTAIHNLGKELKLNRDLDCDVQQGDNYSEIH